MKKKKICIITTIGLTMETFIIPAMKEIIKKGYDVTLICSMTDDFKRKYSEDFHCIDVKMKRGYTISEIFTKPLEFYKIFKREKFDYVQYVTANVAWYASIAAWFARVPIRVKCFWGFLYSSENGLKRKMLWFIEKLPCYFSNYFLVASHINRQIAIDDNLCKASNSEVIGDGGTVGVDLNEFDYNKRSEYKEQILSKYPQLKDKVVYGYLGRIDVDKGINELLNAFIDLNNPHAALLLIGPFDDIRSGLDEDLIRKAKQHPNIVFAGFTSEVYKYVSAVDILIHPTYREGFSMAIQQAMAMGCAIITTDIPGPSEVIEDGGSGVLVPVKDETKLKDAMNRLFNNKQERESFSKQGLMRVREKFSRERMIKLTYESIQRKFDKINE